MKLPIYQVDAFAAKTFEGNPAAVVPLDSWLTDALMQRIAEENNLAETAFFVPKGDRFHIRWFTPNSEVKLCGHATLASAFVLFDILHYGQDQVVFDSLSGPLSVKRKDGLLQLNFPVQTATPCVPPVELMKALGAEPLECYSHDDYMVVIENEEELLAIQPDFEALKQIDLRGVIVTARSSSYDFVVRFFAPKFGIPEDSVTGSAYTKLTPYWAEKLGKKSLKAKQVSSRGGEVFCELAGDRVLISGAAVLFMEGSITLPDIC